uniref:Uncharacterized protein n=1 Tax=Glossina pallidipes TaxID=7398 RepID=A0A1B0A3Q0_GLOPL
MDINKTLFALIIAEDIQLSSLLLQFELRFDDSDEASQLTVRCVAPRKLNSISVLVRLLYYLRTLCTKHKATNSVVDIQFSKSLRKTSLKWRKTTYAPNSSSVNRQTPARIKFTFKQNKETLLRNKEQLKNLLEESSTCRMTWTEQYLLTNFGKII